MRGNLRKYSLKRNMKNILNWMHNIGHILWRKEHQHALLEFISQNYLSKYIVEEKIVFDKKRLSEFMYGAPDWQWDSNGRYYFVLLFTKDWGYYANVIQNRRFSGIIPKELNIFWFPFHLTCCKSHQSATTFRKFLVSWNLHTIFQLYCLKLMYTFFLS